MTATADAHATTNAPFTYLAGDPSLDLVNTVDWTDAGPVDERLTSYDRLTRWAEGTDLVAAATAEHLRSAARRNPRAARLALARAKRVRGVLQRLFAEIALGAATSAVLDDFNGELAATTPWLHIGARSKKAADQRPLAWTWRPSSDRLDALLWPVVWSAAKLLTSEDAARIRMCAGPQCGWMYVDRSRNGLRRWCAMETCGTSEKSRRRRDRQPPTRGR
jgi:predicted RNA-binding Zn ribbon-like protein